MWNQERTTKESAQQVFAAIAQLTEALARLQEQQTNDNERHRSIKEEVNAIRHLVRDLELKSKDFQSLLARIEYLEAKLTTFGADFERGHVTHEEFMNYLNEVAMKEEKLRYERATAEAEKIKTTRKQWGLMAAGFLGGLVAIAPKLWEMVVWIFDQISK